MVFNKTVILLFKQNLDVLFFFLSIIKIGVMETENEDQKNIVKEELTLTEKKRNYVYPVRDWKEYFGESLLIIFSVLLALFLTDYINKQQEKRNTKNLLNDILVELTHNRIAILEMQGYNQKVIDKIDSVLVNIRLQNELVSNDEFHLKLIAPDGVLYRYPRNEAWTIAINNNIMSKTDVETATSLTQLYEDQGKIAKVEEDVAKILFDRASRDPKQVHLTLEIIKDIYRAWAVDRLPGLIIRIDDAIGKIEKAKL